MTKDLNYYLSLPYPIELIPDEDGYWFVRTSLLAGCMTNGDSREDALAMIDDAKQLWLETALELGKAILRNLLSKHKQMSETHKYPR